MTEHLTREQVEAFKERTFPLALYYGERTVPRLVGTCLAAMDRADAAERDLSNQVAVGDEVIRRLQAGIDRLRAERNEARADAVRLAHRILDAQAGRHSPGYDYADERAVLAKHSDGSTT